jgi:PAS domain S-box-containing protein
MNHSLAEAGDLLQIIQSLSETLRLHDLLDRIVEVVQEKTEAERVLIARLEDGDWFIEAVAPSTDPAAQSGMHLPLSGEVHMSMEVFKTVVHDGKPVVLADRERGTSSVLCCPIRHGGAITTVLYLENNRTVGAFTEDHIETLRLLSAHIAIALENASIHDRLNTVINTQRENEERLRLALEGTSDGIWDWNYRTGQAYFNDRYYTMLGYEPGDFPASFESWRGLLHPDDAEKAEKTIQKAIQDNTNYSAEFRLRARNGEWRWILGRGKVAALDEEGRVARVAGSHTDITERKRTEEALEKRLLALLRPLDVAEGIAFEDMFNLADLQLLQDQFAWTCGVAALITRPDGTPITRPSNFTDLCGNIIRKTGKGIVNCNYSDSMIGKYNPNGPNIQPCLSAGLCNAGASITVGGRHVANWLIGQVRNETQDEQQIVEYGREIGVDETVFRAAYRKVPSMSQRQFERIAHFLFIVANQISSVAYQNIQQARFLVERRSAEKEVHRLNHELERRVIERTAQLEATNKELEGFSYSVSHDLRAPLRAIHGYARMLEEKSQQYLNDEGRRFCSIISSEAAKMEALTSGLLQLSRAGRLSATTVSLDMESMVRNVFQESTTPLERQRIHFHVEAMPTAVGDMTLIRQVWVNLVTNAIKYSSKRPLAEIHVGGEIKNDEYVYWVRDNGVGFDMKYADKLFGMFQRLHAQAEFEGNGIGLAIAQRIIHRHGGKVWASAEVDKGATFFFSIPAAPGNGPGL